MKALISTNEVYTLRFISSWIDGEPQYEEIENCYRVADVAANEFEVHSSLFWVDCPDDCMADQWYYKDGLHKNPEDAPNPDKPIEE